MTPTLTTGIASEGGHWYTKDGEPAYEIEGRNGQLRPTTLRDARSLRLLPSVTTIIRSAAAPGLENWKIEQGILAALTLPRRDGEAEAAWLDRVKQDSQEQARQAADRGTAIHASIQSFYDGLASAPEHAAVVRLVDERIRSEFGDQVWVTEQAFAHELGFGGKADMFTIAGEQDVLLDIKTKDTWNPLRADRLAYDEHAIQLAAYRVGLVLPGALCGNLFVSRQEPWQVHLHLWDEAALERGWAMFESLLAYWKAKSDYDPAWQEGVDVDGIPF